MFCAKVTGGEKVKKKNICVRYGTVARVYRSRKENHLPFFGGKTTSEITRGRKALPLPIIRSVVSFFFCTVHTGTFFPPSSFPLFSPLPLILPAEPGVGAGVATPSTPHAAAPSHAAAHASSHAAAAALVPVEELNVAVLHVLPVLGHGSFGVAVTEGLKEEEKLSNEEHQDYG